MAKEFKWSKLDLESYEAHELVAIIRRLSNERKKEIQEAQKRGLNG